MRPCVAKLLRTREK
jgi:hypothetical protein